nr:peptide-binding protein [Candidatus Shapirobacteria bacterium]
QYLFWHSTQKKTNITKINNPRIDKLLEEGRQTFDQQERKNIYQEFQKNLLEECPAIFLKYPIVYTISRIK